jgi:hypothetical protein
LCREFRQRHGTPSDVVPYIIIVTANEGVDVINQALDCGANDYMPKPVNVKVLQVRLRVAERLLAQAQTLARSGGATGSGPLPAAPVANQDDTPVAQDFGPPQDTLISLAVDHADAPITLVDVGDDNTPFRIIYANSAMTATTESSDGQLLGKSLADLEAWTPEFRKMALGYVDRGAILSHVPLWSRTRQAVPVHLSFYPIQGEDENEKHYLVIHHF